MQLPATPGQDATREADTPTMSMYQKTIAELAPEYDARLVEGWLRLEYGTLDHLTSERFASAVKLACMCIDEAGIDESADLARGYGLIHQTDPYTPIIGAARG